jgi:hypothetical protein
LQQKPLKIFGAPIAAQCDSLKTRRLSIRLLFIGCVENEKESYA